MGDKYYHAWLWHLHLHVSFYLIIHNYHPISIIKFTTSYCTGLLVILLIYVFLLRNTWSTLSHSMRRFQVASFKVCIFSWLNINFVWKRSGMLIDSCLTRLKPFQSVLLPIISEKSAYQFSFIPEFRPTVIASRSASFHIVYLDLKDVSFLRTSSSPSLTSNRIVISSLHHSCHRNWILG